MRVGPFPGHLLPELGDSASVKRAWCRRRTAVMGNRGGSLAGLRHADRPSAGLLLDASEEAGIIPVQRSDKMAEREGFEPLRPNNRKASWSVLLCCYE
jgi:hypothetical protein